MAPSPLSHSLNIVANFYRRPTVPLPSQASPHGSPPTLRFRNMQRRPPNRTYRWPLLSPCRIFCLVLLYSPAASPVSLRPLLPPLRSWTPFLLCWLRSLSRPWRQFILLPLAPCGTPPLPPPCVDASMSSVSFLCSLPVLALFTVPNSPMICSCVSVFRRPSRPRLSGCQFFRPNWQYRQPLPGEEGRGAAWTDT